MGSPRHTAAISFSRTRVFLPSYVRKNGLLFTGDSLEWLKTIQDDTIDLIFADPPYNIKKADWDKFESQEAYIQWSMQWIAQAARILKPTGSLYICGFSEILADLKHPAMKYFSGCQVADLALSQQGQFRQGLGPLPREYPPSAQDKAVRPEHRRRPGPLWGTHLKISRPSPGGQQPVFQREKGLLRMGTQPPGGQAKGRL